MQKIDLHDTMAIGPATGHAHAVAVNDPLVPQQEDNIVYRALEAWCRETGTDSFFDVRIEKKIPMAAGLGGGSSDAAAVLAYLNDEADTNHRLSKDALRQLAATLGADVPFCLSGITALCQGIGEIIEPLPPLDPLPMLLIKGDRPVCTKAAFAALDRNQADRKPIDHLEIVTSLRSKTAQAGFSDSNHFLLNQKDNDDYKKITRILARVTPLFSGLSGSGPTCFLIFENEHARERARQLVETEFEKDRLIETAIARTV